MDLQSEMDRAYVAPATFSPIEAETVADPDNSVLALTVPITIATDWLAIVAGGADNGPPGLRPHYHPNYYGAFVRDPDGHNVEAVCHLPG